MSDHMMTANEVKQTEAREELKLSTVVDIYQNETGFMIRADLPGVSKENVSIELENKELRLEAKRPGRQLGKTWTPDRRYRRTFRIAEDVDADGIDASLADGVLSVVLPKAKPPEARKISIR